jgi:hypothetical protein
VTHIVIMLYSQFLLILYEGVDFNPRKLGFVDEKNAPGFRIGVQGDSCT